MLSESHFGCSEKIPLISVMLNQDAWVEPSPDLSAWEKRSHIAWMYLWIAFPTSSSRSSAHYLKNWKTTAHIILKFFVWIGKLPCNSVCKVREKSLAFLFSFCKTASPVLSYLLITFSNVELPQKKKKWHGRNKLYLACFCNTIPQTPLHSWLTRFCKLPVSTSLYRLTLKSNRTER